MHPPDVDVNQNPVSLGNGNPGAPSMEILALGPELYK